MAEVKKIKLPDNSVLSIQDVRIPDISNSTAGQILKVNSARTAFELANESVTTITIRRWEEQQ